MSDCNTCIFILLGHCPVDFKLNNAACLTLYKNIETCKSDSCSKCQYLEYCKEEGINLNNYDNKRI